MATQTHSNPPHSSDERFAAVERTMERFNYQKDGLIETLITAQEVFGGLSKDVLTFVSDRLHVPMNKVYGVATFYDSFTLEPVAETHTEVCTGPMCTVAGADEVLHAACKHSGIRQAGQISADGTKSVREVSCLGLCGQPPGAGEPHPL
jgi:bidirectional [NiFe] hydrogenase diaphorase subunit